MTTVPNIVARWDASIAATCHSLDAILADAAAGSASVAASLGTDLAPLANAWGAVQHQLHAHTERISDAWDEISDELCDVEECSEAQMDKEGNKRDLWNTELEIRYTRAYRAAMAQGAEVLRRRALASDGAAAACTQCAAPLSDASPVAQALNVTCVHCQAVNTVMPRDALRMFAASGAMFLGEVAAQEAWEGMTRTEAQINSYRTAKEVPLKLLSDYEAWSRHYWTTRLEVEASYVPEEQQYVERRLSRYMKDTEKKLRGYWQWRQRHG